MTFTYCIGVYLFCGFIIALAEDGAELHWDEMPPSYRLMSLCAVMIGWPLWLYQELRKGRD